MSWWFNTWTSRLTASGQDSFSREPSEEMILSKYLKKPTIFSLVLSMCMLGGGATEPWAGWWRTSVLLRLMVIPTACCFCKLWHNGLKVRLHVSNKCTVICKEHFKAVAFVGFDVSLQSPKVKQVSIQPVLPVDTTVEILEGMSENATEGDVEQCRGEDTAWFHSIGDVKGRRGDSH